MHVEVDDRHALDPERALCRARGDRDVVEDAEAHRARRQRMVTRRSHERERTAQRGLYRGSGRDARSLEGRPARDRVGVEPLRLGDGSDPRDVLGRVHEQQLLLACRATLAPQVPVLEQRGQPLAPLRVVAGGMEARERRVRQDVDRTISASSSRLLPSPCATPSR